MLFILKTFVCSSLLLQMLGREKCGEMGKWKQG